MFSDRPRYGFDRYSSVRIAYGPSFAPDGKNVSFISDITGVPQAWILDVASCRIDQLTLFHGPWRRRKTPNLVSGHGESRREEIDRRGRVDPGLRIVFTQRQQDLLRVK